MKAVNFQPIHTILENVKLDGENVLEAVFTSGGGSGKIEIWKKKDESRTRAT